MRPDLLWTVNALARQLTKWNRACDIRLKKMIGYMKGTREKMIVSYIGDPLDKCKLLQCSDASYASDIQDSKSVSGMYIALVGPNTFCPITFWAKKQIPVSRSSAEAELVSLDAGLKHDGIPFVDLRDVILHTFHPEMPEVTGKNILSARDHCSPLDQVILDIDAVPGAIGLVPKRGN